MLERKRPQCAHLVKDFEVPKFFLAKQTFKRPKLDAKDIPADVQRQLSQEPFCSKVKPGMQIAITCSSRGIANQNITIKAIADFCKSRGAIPFIVPAMGSHGNATAEGQRAICESYGVTEEFCGCEIRSSMETVKIGSNERGDVYIDKNAAQADGIILQCRIKPHTAFRGPYESGMMKMMTIGLGKQHGAEQIHQFGFGEFARNLQLWGHTILTNTPILFGVAAIENAYDETARLAVVDSTKIEETEPQLLKEAYSNMARIIPGTADILIVDKIGKNYSGDGMDPNISGRFCTPYASGGLDAERVCILDLCEETHNNANGMGLADVITQRLLDKVDFDAGYTNTITGGVLVTNFVPITMESDKEAIQLCIRTLIKGSKKRPRIVRIKNTMEIGEILLSEAYLDELEQYPELEQIGPLQELPFNENGDLW